MQSFKGMLIFRVVELDGFVITAMLHCLHLDQMDHDARKPVFGVSDKARLKQVSSTTESS